MSDVVARVADVERRITAACARAGRPRSAVTLVAASKAQSRERLRSAWAAGVRIFGENRVQEAQLHRGWLPEGADWHFIGPLQSNKVRAAVSLARTFHAVDRTKIARFLAAEGARQGVAVEGFLEVNLGAEESKHGFPVEGFLAAVEPCAALPGLTIVGLMAIPPWSDDPEAMRPWFRRLRELRDELAARPPWRGFPGLLSMGMSLDFEVAIEEGATHVRVGTALFGERPAPAG